jgi:RimJ/RimL family protein N-acetyltransferase
VDKIFRNAPPASRLTAHESGSEQIRSTWRTALPVLTSRVSTLREPEPTDARALLTAVDGRDLIQLLPADAQPNLKSVEEFIATARSRRAGGTGATWVVVPAGGESAVGLVSLQGLDHGFTMVGITAALAEEFRGTGLFRDASRQVLQCLFASMGVHRIEARVDIRNARANGALRNLGATQEGVLRRARFCDGAYHDDVMWALVADDWSELRNFDRVSIH